MGNEKSVAKDGDRNSEPITDSSRHFLTTKGSFQDSKESRDYSSIIDHSTKHHSDNLKSKNKSLPLNLTASPHLSTLNADGSNLDTQDYSDLSQLDPTHLPATSSELGSPFWRRLFTLSSKNSTTIHNNLIKSDSPTEAKSDGSCDNIAKIIKSMASIQLSERDRMQQLKTQQDSRLSTISIKEKSSDDLHYKLPDPFDEDDPHAICQKNNFNIISSSSFPFMQSLNSTDGEVYGLATCKSGSNIVGTSSLLKSSQNNHKRSETVIDKGIHKVEEQSTHLIRNRTQTLGWLKKLGSAVYRRADSASKTGTRNNDDKPQNSNFTSENSSINDSSEFVSHMQGMHLKGLSRDKETIASLVQDIRKHSQEDSQIVLLPDEEFWSETANNSADIHKTRIFLSLVNIDQSAKIYENEFVNKDHANYAVMDVFNRKMILSILQNVEQNSKYRTILRTNDKILPGTIDRRLPPQPMSLEQIIRFSIPGSCVSSYTKLKDNPQIAEKLMIYDNQAIPRSFKFGILYQKKDQISEEEMYSNTDHSNNMQTFLDFIAKPVTLSDHTGFCGGLDTKYGLTGSLSYYTTFENNEIMFHVSTLLPHSCSDPQQIERKRHIGNDIVTIIFQEPGAHFCPSVISSQFLQVFICIQPTDDNSYRVGVTAKSNVSRFGPFIEGVGYYNRDEIFRKCLFSKLINAQIAACNSSGKIGSMLRRRRHMLFDQLYEELVIDSKDKLDKLTQSPSSMQDDPYNGSNSNTNGRFLRRKLTQRSKSVEVQPVSEHHIPISRHDGGGDANKELSFISVRGADEYGRDHMSHKMPALLHAPYTIRSSRFWSKPKIHSV